MTQIKGKLLSDNSIDALKISDNAIENRHLLSATKKEILNYKLVRTYREINPITTSLASSDLISEAIYNALTIKKFHGNETTDGILTNNSAIDKCLIRKVTDHSVIFKDTYPVYGRCRKIENALSGTLTCDNTIIINGSGTLFLTELGVGNIIELPNGECRKVLAVNSDIELVIDLPTTEPTIGQSQKIELLVDYKFFNIAEQTYTFENTEIIDILVPEMVGIDNASYDFSTKYISWQVFGNASSSPGTTPSNLFVVDVKTIVTENVIPDLNAVPSDVDSVFMFVNGVHQRLNFDFFISGVAVSWNPTNAGFDLEPLMIVEFKYLSGTVLSFPSDQKTIITQNIIPDLDNFPLDENSVMMFISGVGQRINFDFVVSGKSVLWNENNAGFNLDPGMLIDFRYLFT